ncbi:murein peptide amidase A, partial [Oxalobacteraceae bacterium OM1]
MMSLPVVAHAATPAQQAEWCKRLTPRLPTVSAANCQKVGLTASGAQSLKGFPLLVRDFPAAGKKDPVRILLLGGIHGDELTASAVVFQWMQWMQSAPASQFQWRVVPVANPDGLLAAKPQRVNA